MEAENSPSIVTQIMKPLYKQMSEGFLPSLPPRSHQLSEEKLENVLKEYWNNATDIILHKEELANFRELKEKLKEGGEIEDIDIVLGQLTEENLIYNVEIGIELEKEEKFLLTPLGICFLFYYEKQSGVVDYKENYLEASKILGKCQNFLVTDRLSNSIGESKRPLTDKERILAALVLFCEATGKNRALNLVKAPESSDKLYIYGNHLMEASELLSRLLLDTSLNVFNDIDDFHNTVRNRKRIKKRTYGIFDWEKLEDKNGYKLYFKTGKDYNLLEKVTGKILEGVSEEQKRELLNFFQEYINNPGSLIKRSIRRRILDHVSIDFEFLSRLERIIEEGKF